MQRRIHGAVLGAAFVATIFACRPAMADTASDQAGLCSSVDANADVAIAACTWVIQSGRWIGPDLAWAFADRCRVYYIGHQYDLAIADCTQAIGLKQDTIGALQNRGGAYNSKGQYALAIADFTQAIRLTPNDALSFFGRGLAYQYLNRYSEALADYAQAIRLRPNFSEAIKNRDQLNALKSQPVNTGPKTAEPGRIADANAAPKVPTITVAFLLYCPDHEKACEDYFVNWAVAVAMANALQGNNRFCASGDAWKAEARHKDAYEAYLKWARLHPELDSKTTNESISAALDELYPCKLPPIPSSAEFIAKCRVDPDDCVGTVIARTLRLTFDNDPNLCRPDNLSVDQSLADDRAIVETLIANAARLPQNSYAAIENALRARYPCRK